MLSWLIGCGGTPPAPPAATPRPDAPSGLASVEGAAAPGALITLEPRDGPASALPSGPALMDQYGREFLPSILFVRVGQEVEFRNSEDIDHNVLVLRMPTGTTIINESGSRGYAFRHVFQQPGLYDVSCDVHPGMRATIVATTTPFAALADETGRFTIGSVPPGAYVLKTTMQGRETARDVAVSAPLTPVPTR